MADPLAAIDPHMPAGLLRHAIAVANERPAARRLRVRRVVIVNSAVLLISTAGSAVIYAFANPSGTDDDAAFAFAFAAFLLFLLGVWLALLAFIADQFPGAARVGEAIARALQDYLFRGRN